MKDSNVLKWGVFGYKKSTTNKVQFNYLTRELNEDVFERDNIKILRHFSLDIILRVNDFHRYPVKTFPELNTDKVDEYSVIRNWIYKLLENDMEDIFEENEISDRYVVFWFERPWDEEHDLELVLENGKLHEIR